MHMTPGLIHQLTESVKDETRHELHGAAARILIIHDLAVNICTVCTGVITWCGPAPVIPLSESDYFYPNKTLKQSQRQ